MTLHEFAEAHDLPRSWLELRNNCEQLVSRSDFWYRPQLQDQARQLAIKASDMLASLPSSSQYQFKKGTPHAG